MKNIICILLTLLSLTISAQRERIKAPVEKEGVEIFDLLDKPRSFNKKTLVTAGVISSFSSSGTYIYLKDERRPGGSLYVNFKKDQKQAIINLRVGQRIVIQGRFESDSNMSQAVLLPADTKIKTGAVDVIETTITQLEEEYKVPLRAVEKYKGKHIKLKAKIYNIYTSSSSGSIQLGLKDEEGSTLYCSFASKFKNGLIDIAENDFVEIMAYCSSTSLSLTGIAIQIIDRFADVEPAKITISKLYYAYAKKPIEAVETYTNKPVLIRGKRGDISSSSSDSVSCIIYSNGKIRCRFSKKNAQALKDIRSGRYLYVLGIVSPSSDKRYIYMEDCQVYTE